MFHEQMMNNNENETNKATWQSLKNDGKKYYDNEHYEKALNCFQNAVLLNNSMSINDHQIILSNIIACRLKLAVLHNDVNEAQSAIDDSKQCIHLNPKWSKAYVRLASAYIMKQSLFKKKVSVSTTELPFNYSNDACNALQTALRYDTSNQIARQMLVRELRNRDKNNVTRQNDTTTSSSTTTNQQQPDLDNSRDPPMNPNFRHPSSEQQQQQQQQSRQSTINSTTFNDIYNDIDIDHVDNDNNTNTIHHYIRKTKDWITNEVQQLKVLIQQQIINYQIWYYNQSNDFQTGIKILLLLVILYIAFGGRFGLNHLFQNNNNNYNNNNSYNHDTTTSTSSSSHTKGNYGDGNVYDQYRRQQQQATENDIRNQPQSSSSNTNTETNHNDNYNHQHDTYSNQQQQQNTGINGIINNIDSFFGNIFVSFGGFQNVALIAIVMYICHRNGVNPINAFMIVQTIQGGRRGMYGGGGGGYGGGFGGGGGHGGGHRGRFGRGRHGW